MSQIVSVRERPWDPSTVFEVALRPKASSYGDVREWEVVLDGFTVGYVKRYTGSLDRKSGRLRVEGRRRVLWAYRRPGPEHVHRYLSGQYSRADCIRALVR